MFLVSIASVTTTPGIVRVKYSGAANSSVYVPASKPVTVYSPFPFVGTDRLGRDGNVVLVALTDTFASGKFVVESVTLPEIAPGSLILALISVLGSPSILIVTGVATESETASL
jgi:hypothetical protein